MKYIILFILTLGITLIIYPNIIQYLHQLKFGQSIRIDGPQSHHQKKGTPTMGGIGFLIIPFFTLIAVDFTLLFNRTFWAIYVAYFSFGLIGFIDDFLIVVQKKNDGLKPKLKLLGQVVSGGFFLLTYYPNLDSVLYLPFLKIALPMWVYIIMMLFLFTAESNAVNITDGIDGLCASVFMVCLLPIMYISYMKQSFTVFSVAISIFAALLGYLKFNKHPAKVFMGDTGSLALGGILVAFSIILKIEILLLFLGIVFLVETGSVVLQVCYFKLTHGKRIFKMSPIHHHYEQLGWDEKTIVYRFSIVGAIGAILGVILWLWM